MNSFPKPITVTIRYDKELQKITGVASEDAIVSEHFIFLFMLKTIFDEHPEIEKQYPPGEIALRLNNRAPAEMDTLEDGDIISLTAARHYPRIS